MFTFLIRLALVYHISPTPLPRLSHLLHKLFSFLFRLIGSHLNLSFWKDAFLICYQPFDVPDFEQNTSTIRYSLMSFENVSNTLTVCIMQWFWENQSPLISRVWCHVPPTSVHSKLPNHRPFQTSSWVFPFFKFANIRLLATICLFAFYLHFSLFWKCSKFFL